MKNSTNSKALLLVLSLIFLAAFTRLIPHWPNFTAVGAMALFGSAVFKKKHFAFIVPLFAMWFSDLFLNNLVYSSETFVWFASYQLYTLVPMALIVLMGIFLFKDGKSANKVLTGSIAATVIFFLVSNFGTWISPYSIFPDTFSGLISTYVAGLPFALNSLAGNVFFATALFGSYALATKKFPSLKLA